MNAKARRSITVAVMTAMSFAAAAYAEGGPKTPEAFAAQYMAAFNKKDSVALDKLSFPVSSKSPMQEMMDEISNEEMKAGVQYNKFEIAPPEPKMAKPMVGMDGRMYEPNLKITNMVKLIKQSANGTQSSEFPIGSKDGIYYRVSPVPSGPPPEYKFGWQRFTPPKAAWSVLMPNEPEPGRAAIAQSGKVDDPDAYGVVKNTADIKTTERIYTCGDEGKRLLAPDNQTTFRASCTTYDPGTLEKWFSDPQKNLADAVQMQAAMAKLSAVEQQKVALNGAPGIVFRLRTPEGHTVLGRVYWINNALYQLTYDTKKSTLDEASARKFLESLEVK